MGSGVRAPSRRPCCAPAPGGQIILVLWPVGQPEALPQQAQVKHGHPLARQQHQHPEYETAASQ